MNSIFDDQAEFMLKGLQTTNGYNETQKEMYEDLIDEETDEFQEACINEPLANQIKEACDILVVVSGWLHSIGVEPQVAWDSVHSNNMWKVVNPPIKNAKGKIQKSPLSIKSSALMMEILEKLVEKDMN